MDWNGVMTAGKGRCGDWGRLLRVIWQNMGNCKSITQFFQKFGTA